MAQSNPTPSVEPNDSPFRRATFVLSFLLLFSRGHESRLCRVHAQVHVTRPNAAHHACRVHAEAGAQFCFRPQPLQKACAGRLASRPLLLGRLPRLTFGARNCAERQRLVSRSNAHAGHGCLVPQYFFETLWFTDLRVNSTRRQVCTCRRNLRRGHAAARRKDALNPLDDRIKVRACTSRHASAQRV